MKKRSRLKTSLLVFILFAAILIIVAYLAGYLLLDLSIGDIYIVTGLSLLAAGIGAFGGLIVDFLKPKRK